jgi:hypothetical protein
VATDCSITAQHALKKIEAKLPDSKSTLNKQNKGTAIFDAAMVT